MEDVVASVLIAFHVKTAHVLIALAVSSFIAIVAQKKDPKKKTPTLVKD